MNITNFRHKLNFSNNKDEEIKKLLKKIFNTNYIKKNDVNKDDKGIDYFVDNLYIDVKVRSIKNIYNDLALEIWSNIESKKVGWTLDDNKLTDYVIWIWLDDYYIIKFQELKTIFRNNLREWRKKYKTATQITRNGNYSYKSECVFVPIQIIENEKFWI